MRSLIRSQSSFLWHSTMSGISQIARAAGLPLQTILNNSPLRPAVSTIQDQMGRAFDTAVKLGDDFQQRTIDLLFDVTTAAPIWKSLEDAGIVSSRIESAQPQPELAFLEAVNDSGPTRSTLLLIAMVMLYTSLKREQDGIARLESYLRRYALTAAQKAAYLSSLALLRASRAKRLSFLQLPETVSLLQDMAANLKEAKELTRNEPDFSPNLAKLMSRWTSGVLNAQLPWPLGDRAEALEDLVWCEKVINSSFETRESGFQFLRQVYYSRAFLARDAGDQKTAQQYLEKSGYKDYNPENLFIASIFACTSDGTRDGPQQVKEVVPGHVFTVSGLDLSDYNFFITEDGQQLVAIDSGSRADRCEAAYRLFEKVYTERYQKAVPLLTHAFMTHYHWDHTGGYPFFQSLNPNLAMYSRHNYTEERERAAHQPPPFEWILGLRFTDEPVARYVPTQTVPADTEMVLGGTRIRLILTPGGGGETPDGMFIYLPAYRVLYAGDFAVPWVGTPYVVEGDADAQLATMELVGNLQPPPEHLLHGHWAVTQFYSVPDVLVRLRPHLQWLKDKTLELIYANKSRTEIQQMNLIPPGLLAPEEVETLYPFLSTREVFINRICLQKIGYWGPQLQNTDILSEREFGAIFRNYLELSEEQMARVVQRIIDAGDYELAARVADWAATQFANSPAVRAVQRTAFQQLKQKWQLLNVFKFAMYCQHINDPTPQVD